MKEISCLVSYLTTSKQRLSKTNIDNFFLFQAKKLAQGLADEYDPIRKKYWMMRIDQMQKRK